MFEFFRNIYVSPKKKGGGVGKIKIDFPHPIYIEWGQHYFSFKKRSLNCPQVDGDKAGDKMVPKRQMALSAKVGTL